MLHNEHINMQNVLVNGRYSFGEVVQTYPEYSVDDQSILLKFDSSVLSTKLFRPNINWTRLSLYFCTVYDIFLYFLT